MRATSGRAGPVSPSLSDRFTPRLEKSDLGVTRMLLLELRPAKSDNSGLQLDKSTLRKGTGGGTVLLNASQ
jgi:hypothetical protein